MLLLLVIDDDDVSKNRCRNSISKRIGDGIVHMRTKNNISIFFIQYERYLHSAGQTDTITKVKSF